MDLTETIDLHGRYRPDRAAIEEAGRRVTYRELAGAVRRCASHLGSVGVVPGDVVGICLRESVAHLEILLALARLGAVSLPMDWRWTEAEQTRIARAFGAVLVLVEPERWRPEGVPAVPIDEAWRRMAAAAPDDAPAFADEHAPALLALSSGTTGEPTAVVLSQAQYAERIHKILVACSVRAHDRHLSALPLAFTGGRQFALSILYVGATLVLFPTLAGAEEIVAAVTERDLTTALLVPTQLRALLKLPAGGRPLLHPLRLLLSTGAGLFPAERAAIRSRLTPNFVEYYATSGGSMATVQWPEDQESEPESVGRPVPGVALDIVDEAGRPLPPNEIGEVRYRGPGLPLGYWGTGATADSGLRDGWHHPGDFGFLNERGYLFLRGRASDRIKRGGLTIFAPEVERALLTHPAVAEAAVIGVPSTDYGEEVAAYVVSRGPVTSAELDSHCRAILAPYKVPRLFSFMPALPRTSAGKIIKAQLPLQAPG